ncbi:PD-(D/E)XK nuclease family protein [Plantibacter sp. YIM 135347]|uniref:PD-(D/E)XK nuclease family protein n=1 Tax=Plantibacter sp. YIM 135347 TaxID=3423919 RepID=UPI003D3318CA
MTNQDAEPRSGATRLDESPAAAGAAAAGSGVVLDPSQRAVLDLPDGMSAAVLGVPGSGKTQTLVEAVAERIHGRGYGTDEVLVIAASRTSSQVLRDRLERRVAQATPGALARTAVSVAMEVIAASGAFVGGARPRLLTGGEQDQTIADRLLGDEEAGVDLWPAELGPEVRILRGFRTELRNLMERGVEHGVDPDRLERLGREHDRQEWIAAAGFIRGYLADDWRGHLTPASALAEAVRILEEPQRPDDAFAGLRVVFVDDAQEATHGVLQLLRALAARGITVIAFGDPDITTGAFHGARADALGRFGQALGVPVSTLALEHAHRGDASLRTVVDDITRRIGTAGAGRHRRVEAVSGSSEADASSTGSTETDAGGSVALARPAGPSAATVLVGSAAEQIAVIARFLRERHVLHGVPWTEMAVAVRNGGLVPALERGLAALEVPTSASTRGEPLRDQRVVRAVLLALQAALGRLEFDAETVIELLQGALGGMEAIGVRRLRAALRHEELAQGLDRNADELLVEAFAVPASLALLETPAAAKAHAIAASVATAAEEAAAGASVEELIWGLWSRSRLERVWVQQSKGVGQTAEEANRNLDAITQLADSARTFVETEPDTPASVFLDRLLEQEVADDSLAPRGLRQAVVIGTPASMIGLEADTIVVAGLQDGVWPNLRVRDTLLGATELVDVLEGVSTATTDARRAVLHDELRLFAQAASRASSALLMVAVDDEDEQPSPFFSILPAPDAHRAALPPLSLRGLVGTLRRTLTDGRRSITAEDREIASAALAILADEGVPGADSASWYGIAAPSTDAPLRDLADGDLPISPSRMEAFEECPLKWVIDQLGGGSNNAASGLGTIIHKALEDAESSDEASLWAAVDARWGELRFEAGWDGVATKAKAREMVASLADYLQDAERNGVTAIGRESRFSLPIPLGGGLEGSAVLSGSVDRVERRRGADGGPDRVVIADLKTGTSAPTADKDVADLAQLGAYQLALAEGVIPGTEDLIPAGAKLIVVAKRTKTKPFHEPSQPPLDDEELEAFRDRVRRDAMGMASAVFDAHIGTHCYGAYSFGECAIHVVKAVSS